MSDPKPQAACSCGQSGDECHRQPSLNDVQHGEARIDVELMKALAKSVAEETVKELRDEIRKDIKDIVSTEVKTAFGEMSPFEHALQHSRFNKFLDWTDKISENFWGGIVSGIVRYVGGLFLLGYFVWHQTGGKV